MSETKNGNDEKPTHKLTSKLEHLVPYEVVEDWTIGRAEEVEGARTKPVDPWGIVNDKRVDPSELIASPEEKELIDFYDRVEAIFRQVGFEDDDFRGSLPVRKSMRIPKKDGVVWFEYFPPNPEKEWLPNDGTMEIFEVKRGEIKPTLGRRLAETVGIKRDEYEVLEVGPYGQARWNRHIPKLPGRRASNEEEAVKMTSAEVAGNKKVNPEVLISDGRQLLNRIAKMVNPPFKAA